MRFKPIELAFIALGGALGLLTGLAAKAGLLPQGGAVPPFLILLLGLGLVEIVAAYATGRPPGMLVAMPARMLAFALGVGLLLLLGGQLS